MLRFCQLLFSLTQTISLVDMKLLGAIFLVASFLLGTVTAKTTQTDVSKPSQASVNDGNIEVHQICNWGAAKEEVSSLKKEVEKLTKDLTQRLDRIQQKSKWNGPGVRSVK